MPEFERQGFGFEAAAATVDHGRATLGLSRVLAITSQDNEASGKLLDKLGFTFSRLLKLPDGDTVKLFESDL